MINESSVTHPNEPRIHSVIRFIDGSYAVRAETGEWFLPGYVRAVPWKSLTETPWELVYHPEGQ